MKSHKDQVFGCADPTLFNFVIITCIRATYITEPMALYVAQNRQYLQKKSRHDWVNIINYLVVASFRYPQIKSLMIEHLEQII